MHQNIPGNIAIIAPKMKREKTHYRLTVDTEDDLILIKTLIEDFGCDKLSMNEIINVIDKHPELLRINKNSIQKKWND